MVTALLLAPRVSESSSMETIVSFAVVVGSLAVFGVGVWLTLRLVGALERLAMAHERAASVHERTFAVANPPPPRGRPAVDNSSPTRNVLGCLVLGLAIASSSGCSDDAGDDQADGEGDGEGEGGTEPNGETTERACYIIAQCDVSAMPTCADERSDDANEMAEQAKVTCGPAPTIDEQVPAWAMCMAEQCGCSGPDPSTGAQVCE
jgi:hypothetical protein